MSDDEPQVITLAREELYEQVWTTPMRRLCVNFGLSDVGLAKVCKANDIPRPPLGYWAKHERGKAPPRPPLPNRSDLRGLKLTFTVWPCETIEKAPPPAYDDDVAKLLEEVRAMPTIVVGKHLRGLHPLVESTWEVIKDRTWEDHGMVHSYHREVDTIFVRVSRERIQRAILLLDAVVKGIRRIGGSVQRIRKPNWDEHTRNTLLGENVGRLSIREHYNQKRRVPKAKQEYSFGNWDYIPNNCFVLEVGRSYEELEKGRHEDRLNEILVALVRIAGRSRINRAEAEEARVREEEAERIRREREAEENRIRREREGELKRRRDELKARQDAELDRVSRLVAQADGWYRSRRLRHYIRAVQQAVMARDGKITPGGEADQWLRWAIEQADRLDPFRPSPPSVLDETLPQ